MTNLLSLINKYFPTEKIIARQKVKLKYQMDTTALVKYKSWTVNPDQLVEMIETDQKYYFDLRIKNYLLIFKSYPKLLWSILPSGIILWFVTGFKIDTIINIIIGLVIFTLVIFVFIILSSLFTKNILAISKSWIKNQNVQNTSTILEGEFQSPQKADLNTFLKNPSELKNKSLFWNWDASLKLVDSKDYPRIDTTRFKIEFNLPGN